MLNPALDVVYGPPGVALVRGPIQGFGGDPELDHEVFAEILRLALFFS
jgi:hypothetical protein